ncbi:MAG TPA: NADH-quinone oxidoreductase subunit NuoH [Chloroflexota bacterium]|nr:NADH-quinone oxidoreductase subunit NuoH [Chloroflexota bacterium]
MNELLFQFLVAALKSAVIIGVLLTGFAYMTLFERKVAARIQIRYGPNRVGPFGLLQPLADGIKLFFKEDVTPLGADRWVYLLAPCISVLVALVAFAVIPLGPPIEVGGRAMPLYLSGANIGILYVLAVGSLGVYGIALAGWSSNSKYSLLGGIRASAQMISYELSLGLSVMGVVMVVGSLNMTDIVEHQARYWHIFVQPLGFLLYLISGIAETNRAPFDLPEAETELVAGYHTEYSGMKFALFFMAEYINMIMVSSIATTLFLGGYKGPFGLLDGVWWFVIKVVVLLFVYVWVRATLPRMRYDRLMNFGWRVLLPLGLLNVFATAVGILLFG